MVPRTTPVEELALRIARVMKCEIDWAAVPFLAWHYGCTNEFDDLMELIPVVVDRLTRKDDDSAEE